MNPVNQNVATGDTVSPLDSYLMAHDSPRYEVTRSEGRNRQIRRTFSALGFTVTKLHSTHFGSYRLDGLASGEFRVSS